MTNQKKASEVDILEEYNNLIGQLPWKDLQGLPAKLSKLESHPIAKALGVKDLGNFDIASPIKDVVVYLGILVKRLHLEEKKSETLEKELLQVKEELGKLSSVSN